MPSEYHKRHGQAARRPVKEGPGHYAESKAPPPAGGVKEERLRQAYAKDFKAFYIAMFGHVVDEATGRTYGSMLSRVHDLMIDFMCLRELKDCVKHSPLYGLLPERDAQGNYKERWLYWKTLKSKPVIQDGPDGPVSSMFHEKSWQGVLIRICGKCHRNAILVPRGHIKSELGSQAYPLWRVVRDPSRRILIRAIGMDLARKFLSWIKTQFSNNRKFRALYGHYIPRKRETVWSADYIQMFSDKRRGKDPSLTAFGMESDPTGSHFDEAIIDDAVAESNSMTEDQREKTKEHIQNIIPLLDPGMPLTDIGTRWHDDDAHAMFVDKKGAFYKKSSFFVATVIDDDPQGVCAASLGVKGRGNPIWPEKFNNATIEDYKDAMVTDRRYKGQYFNQFFGASFRTFDKEWLAQRYNDNPQDLVRALGLDVYIGIDSTSGKFQQSKDLDFTAAFVLGQTQDRRHFYWLDGLFERLRAEDVGKALVELGAKWYAETSNAATNFKMGIEETAHTHYLFPLIEGAQRDLGVDSLFTIETLKHNNRSKHERICTLGAPYSQRRYFLPKKLIVRAYNERATPYDLVPLFERMFEKYPEIPFDDLMDAHAYAHEMTQRPDFKEQPRGKAKRDDIYARAKATEPESDQWDIFSREEVEQEYGEVFTS